MKLRNTLALAILFLALGAYLYFVESEKVLSESRKTTLLSVQEDDIAKVRLEYPDHALVLTKTDSRWRLEEPRSVEADQTAAENLVRAIASEELKRTLEGDVGSLESYGLDAPGIVVRVTLADGRTLPAVRVGKNTPVGFSTFVQLEDEPEVKLVSSAFSIGMKKELKDLRNKVVIDFEDEDVRRVVIEGEEPTIELTRDGVDWSVERPKKLRADAGEVRSFLSSLKSLRAQDFVDTPASLEEFGLEAPRRRIAIVVGEDQTRKELWVGLEKDRDSSKDLYVKRADGETVFVVGSYARTNLDKGVAAFRDKTVLPVDRERIGAIEVTRADGEAYRLARIAEHGEPTETPETEGESQKPEDRWEVAGAETTKESASQQLVGDVHGLKGYEIAGENPSDLSVYGLTSPALAFSLIDRDGGAMGRILVGKVPATAEGESEEIYAKADGSEIVYRVREYLFSHLDKKREDLVEAPPAAPPAPSADPSAE